MQMIPMQELFTRYSTWAVAVMVAGAEYWLGLSPTDQAALLAAYPLLAKAVPLAGFVVFLGARGLVQSAKPPAE